MAAHARPAAPPSPRRRHRRPVRLGQVQRVPRGRRPARPGVPGHRRDLPGGLLGLSGGAGSTWPTPTRWRPSSAASTSTWAPTRRARPSPSPARTSRRRSGRPGSRPRSAPSRPTWRCGRDLLPVQRELIETARRGPRGGCVAEGRDITTVVAPDADVRVLLTADAQARLARRAPEMHGSADEDSLAATRDQVLRRDADDAPSPASIPPPTASEIDSSALTFEQTVEAVLVTVLGPRVTRRRGADVTAGPAVGRSDPRELPAGCCGPGLDAYELDRGRPRAAGRPSRATR